MAHKLFLGDRLYFTWSLAAWLMFENFGLSDQVKTTVFAADAAIGPALAEFPPARTVPTLITEEGAVVSDSLAIAEELASRYPNAGLWPTDPLARATARTLAAEMHSGFYALRGDWPMNLRLAYQAQTPPDAVAAELARLDLIWGAARARFASQGPWLCGAYSLADAIFAPMAARLACYDFPMSEVSRAYIAAHLADPGFRRWRAMGLAKETAIPEFDRNFARRPWPGPTPLPAKAVETGPSVNPLCPNSGKPNTHFMEVGGRIWGFCNPFCRDKTVIDPEAWPKFMALYNS
jgi:glutathione S-transferase